MELLVTSSEHYSYFSVKLLYHNITPSTTDTTTDTTPVTLPMPGCAELCPLSSWLELTASLRPDDWEAECRTPVVDQANTETLNVDLPPLILLPSLLIVVMLFVFLVRLVGWLDLSYIKCRTLPHIPGQQ